MSLPPQPIRRARAKHRAAFAAIGMLCSSSCGGESDSEAPECESCTDAIDPATLDCNAPVPEQFIAAMGATVEAAPPLPDAAALESMEVVELGTQAGHSLLTIDPQVNPYKVSVPEHCVPLGDEFVATLEICVDAAGSVSGVTLLRNALPIIDSQLPYVISRWRFDPYIPPEAFKPPSTAPDALRVP